jgi:general secretion pathway protein D
MKKILIFLYLITIINLQANSLQISLDDFARTVSAQTDKNIFIDEDFKDKKISLIIPDKISNEDLFNLFKKSISKLDYNLKKTGSAYYLSKKISYENKDYIYKLKYNSSSDCISLLSALGIKNQYLKDSNIFIFKTTSNKYEQIKKYLSIVDIYQKQVMLKIMIFEFNESLNKERGIQYASIYKDASSVVQVALNTIVAPLSTNSPLLSSVNFYSAIRLLNEAKDIKIKQFPYILSKNNKSFKFEAVDNIPYLVTTTTTQATNTSQQNSIDYRDVGLKINGKSFIHDDYITLDLDLIIEDIISSNKNTSSPETYKRVLKSNTNIKYNTVLLLSGLKRMKHDTSDYSIPFISNIPYLGEIFKYHTSSDREINITIAIEVIKSDETNFRDFGLRSPDFFVRDEQKI